MDGIYSLFEKLAVLSESAVSKNEDDFIGEDGLLYCGKCGEAKQCKPFPDNPDAVVYCVCACDRAAEEAQQERIRQQTAGDSRKTCFTSYSTRKLLKEYYSTFDSDDTPEGEVSKAAKGYVKQFHHGADWLILFGTNGIGKSFYAACICNELLKQGKKCLFTSVSEVEKMLWDAENKADVYENLTNYDLVVIDDFGAERDTEYMNEIKFNIIDYLLRTDVPCIITTNLSGHELMNPASNDMQRIISRMYEKSVPVLCKGNDRRKEEMRRNATEKLRRLVSG